jgi:hypothetical protein
VVDCIDNYMFLADHSCDALNPDVPLSYDHSYEGETAIVGDHELVLKNKEVIYLQAERHLQRSILVL